MATKARARKIAERIQEELADNHGCGCGSGTGLCTDICSRQWRR
jgi:hypothetical protein